MKLELKRVHELIISSQHLQWYWYYKVMKAVFAKTSLPPCPLSHVSRNGIEVVQQGIKVKSKIKFKRLIQAVYQNR